MNLSHIKTADPLENQLRDLDKLTATIRDYFGQRAGERELEIERFDLERGEGWYEPDPKLVETAWILFGDHDDKQLHNLTDRQKCEWFFYNNLHEKRDADTRALATIVKGLAVAFEQAQRDVPL